MRCRPAFSPSTSDSHALEMLFRCCRETGFHGLQLRPRHYETFLGDPAGFLGRWSEWAPVASAMSVRCDVRTEEGCAYCQRVVELAVGIDGDLMVLDGDGPSLSADGDSGADSALAHLQGLGRRVRGQGLRLSICNRTGGLVESRRDLEALAAAGTFEALSLTIDTGRILLAGEDDPAALVRDFHRQIENIQLTDIARSRFPMLEDGRAEPRPLGKGDVDFQSLFEALRSTDYAGWLTVVDVAGEATPVERMRQAAEFLQRNGIKANLA